MALDKVKDDMLQDNLVFPGSTTQFPSITTTQRDALSGVQVGTMIYNSTVGNLQQYTSTGWATIAAAPSITSLTYPTESGAVLTALDASGGTEAAQTLIINGSNFTGTVTVEILVGGTYSAFSSSTSVNGTRTQVTRTGVTKRAASDGYTLRVTNSTALSTSTTVNFSADPSFSTAANLGTVFASRTLNKSIAFTGTKVIQGATAKPTWMTVTGNSSTADNGSGDTTFDATGSPAVLAGTAANSGDTQNFTFSIIVRDAENQTFNRDYTLTVSDFPASTNATIVEPASYTGNAHRSHSFLTVGTNTFTVYAATVVDILVVAGGGQGGGQYYAGGGGAGGLRTLTSHSLAAGTYNVVVGAGGSGSNSGAAGNNGDPSSIALQGGSTVLAASGGGGGGSSSNANGRSGGSGGGGSGYSGSSAGAGNAGSYTPVEGYAGGNNSGQHGGSGGGGSSAVGGNGSGHSGGNGGAGTANNWRDGSSGTTAGMHLFASGGGGGTASGQGGGVTRGTGGNAGGGYGGRGTGNGASVSVPGAGTANTGSGGGGADGDPANLNATGGAGGSGIVVIRYAV